MKIKKLLSRLIGCFIVCSLFACQKSGEINDSNLGNTPLKTDGEVITIPNSDITVTKSGDYYAWFDDILLTADQVNELITAYSNVSPLSTAQADVFKYWPGGVVYYTINSSVPDQVRIENAIDYWEQTTSVRFVRRTNQFNYVEFVQSSTICRSDIGYAGGRQIIELLDHCDQGTIIHEIGHTMGLFHEHQRRDRDNYVQIHWSNIKTGREVDFQTYDQRGRWGFDWGPFDFNSIMLYSSYASSKNNNPTITRLDGSTFIAQRNGLSTGDKDLISVLYGPPFVRMREILEDGSGPEYTYITGDIYFDVYADAACTIPYTLPSAKGFAIQTTEGYFDRSSSRWVYSKHTDWFEIPAGVQSLLLYDDVVLNELSTDYGIPQYGQSKTFRLLNGFSR